MDQQPEGLPAVAGQSQTINPGYLLNPLGWAAKPVLTMLRADWSLYPALASLTRKRMHLIALSLAHRRHYFDHSLTRQLWLGDHSTVVQAALGRQPPGLIRALGRLPATVMPEENYRHLVELIEASSTAKLIFHRKKLDAGFLSLLHAIPVPIRRITAQTMGGPDMKPEGLADGLRILVARGVAPSFDALVAKLAAIRQPAQFLPHIQNLVEQLPLPPALPPIVADASRLDDIAIIRGLAKRWKNCLADCYIDAVNNGRAAVYFWSHPDLPAVCVVQRHGRLGWALLDAKGPNNADLPSNRLEEIWAAFAANGIPKVAAIEALECVVNRTISWRHSTRRWPRDPDLDEDEMDDYAACDA